MKKILSLLLSLVISLSMFDTIVVYASDSLIEEKEYVVVIDDGINGENELIEDYNGYEICENTFVCSMTSYEAHFVGNENDVEFVEENIVFDAALDSSDAADIEQWNLNAMEVSDVSIGESINIAILDSGVDYSSDYDVVADIDLVRDGNESAMFKDSTGHGSAIASVIAAQNNDYGIDGVNPYASIYSVKALDSNNQAPLSRIIEGIYWCINNDINIINMSFGTHINSELLHSAIVDAYNAGILLIAAAGNNDYTVAQYPAAYEEVISVGSVDAKGEMPVESVTGSVVDVLAPGENIMATDFIDSVSTVSGTSIATAQVTGVASLLWAIDKNKTNEFIKELICSAVNKPDSIVNSEVGIVNYSAALDYYDEFSEWYESSQVTPIDVTVNNTFDYSDEAVVVDGLWKNSSSGEGHYDLADEAVEYGEFVGNAPDIVRYACTHLDANNTVGGNGAAIGGPHGAGNYVINLRFLYLASRCIYDYGVGQEYYDLVDSYKNNSSYWTVSWHPEKANFDKIRFNCMVNQVNAFLETKDILKDDIRNNFDSYSEISQNRYLGLMIFGMALHLTGDIYAHRTIVPEYTVLGTNGQENTVNAQGQDMIGAKYFAPTGDFVINDVSRGLVDTVCYYDRLDVVDETVDSWQYFQLGVARQVAEFRDINMFLLDAYKGASNPFEDNADFCAERYDASMLACKRITKRFKEAGSFYIKLFYPKAFNTTDEATANNTDLQYVKLNNFKNYTDAAGMVRIGVNLAEEDWSVNSNITLV